MRRVAALGLVLALLCGATSGQTPGTDQWLPRGTADLQILDKVSAHATSITLRVGQAADNASLSIALRACLVRPPSMAPDSAAFLDIQDSRPGVPGFHGWMFGNEPALSMFEHPIYNIHLVACH